MQKGSSATRWLQYFAIFMQAYGSKTFVDPTESITCLAILGSKQKVEKEINETNK